MSTKDPYLNELLRALNAAPETGSPARDPNELVRAFYAYLNEALPEPKAAPEIGCQESTLPKWRQRGIGPKYIKQGKFVRYRRGDILDWHASRTVTPGEVRS